MISTSRRFVFIHNNKAGGTSVREKLSPFADTVTQRAEHFRAYMWKELMGEDLWEEYKTFMVVRNPFPKIVSSYVYRRQLLGITPNSMDAKKKNFLQWLETLRDNPDTEFNDQLEMAGSKENPHRILVDKIILLEDLNRTWPEICQWLGVSCDPLREINKSQVKEKIDWRELYSEFPEAKTIVRELFSRDFQWAHERSIDWNNWEKDWR